MSVPELTGGNRYLLVITISISISRVGYSFQTYLPEILRLKHWLLVYYMLLSAE